MGDSYKGRCDTCGNVMRSWGHPYAVRASGIGTVKFRFCSEACKVAFTSRKDVDDLPETPVEELRALG